MPAIRALSLANHAMTALLAIKSIKKHWTMKICGNYYDPAHGYLGKAIRIMF